jgi:hypothetical protein
MYNVYTLENKPKSGTAKDLWDVLTDKGYRVQSLGFHRQWMEFNSPKWECWLRDQGELKRCICGFGLLGLFLIDIGKGETLIQNGITQRGYE